MLREAIQTVRTCHTLAATVVGVEIGYAVMHGAGANAGAGGALFLLWSALFFSMLRAELTGRSWNGGRMGRVFAVTWRLAVLQSVLVVCSLAAATPFIWGDLSRGVSPDASYLVVVAAFGLGNVLAFATIGTWLPAQVLSLDRGLGAAWRRGRVSFGWVAGRMLLGPGILVVIAISVAIATQTSLGANKPIVDGTFSFIGLVSFTTTAVLFVAAQAMVAHLLAQAYLRHTPDVLPHATAETFA